ncbi:MAG: YerC/YecD family TrpR-related protein [Coriobacteriaceae bacterium]|nr:YerC/YecD family TrpR-related protein [Coriobacteriaceae bacterium]
MADDKVRTDDVEVLLDTIVRLETSDDAYNLLCDLCTVREISEMAQRLQVAKLLDQGVSYVDIQERTGASATTISRVSKCLNYGSGGYNRALEDMDSSGE